KQASPARQAADFPLGLDDSFALNQYDWLSAVRDRRDPETSGREGLRDLAAAYAILESAHARRTVAVEEVLSGELREFQRPIDQHFGIS
ncbi:MAG: gfo/Idh/MocA family oxidoreductase, partial [Planctomycetes bacterium]|nr:gfo/Idh/MocA family oxidoreductase [Planctomycetota bacterium]